MRCVEFLVVSSLMMVFGSASSPDNSTMTESSPDNSTMTASPDNSTMTEPLCGLRAVQMLERIMGYLSFADLHKFYWAVAVLGEPIAVALRQTILRKVEHYAIQNDITLDRDLFEADPMQDPVDMHPWGCMGMYANNDWLPVTQLPNAVCAECYTPNAWNGRLWSSFSIASGGFYEPRLRLRVHEDFEGGKLIVYNGEIGAGRTRMAEVWQSTLFYLKWLQIDKGYQWVSVRFPIQLITTPNNPLTWSVSFLRQPSLTIDLFEMRLTNAEAILRTIDPSVVAFDDRGDALVSFEYQTPEQPQTTVNPT